jgi:hypothetical protein
MWCNWADYSRDHRISDIFDGQRIVIVFDTRHKGYWFEDETSIEMYYGFLPAMGLQRSRQQIVGFLMYEERISPFKRLWDDDIEVMRSRLL